MRSLRDLSRITTAFALSIACVTTRQAHSLTMGASSSVDSSRTPAMRAVVREKGGALVFRDDVASPPPPSKPDEVLVKIGAAGINPVDYKAPKLLMGPMIAGLGFCGTIEALGDGAEHGFKVGDRVFGTTRGSLAERALCRVGALSHAPRGLSVAQAVAMPTVYLTSLQGLTNYGKIAPGAHVLVLGASGGCGTAALQLARRLGASEIVAVCSGKNAAHCKTHGATRVVDYTKENISEVYAAASDAEKFDVVYDCATNSGGGEDYYARSLPLLCEGDDGGRAHGQYVAINGAVGLWLRMMTIGQRANQHLFLTNANTEDLARLADFAAVRGGGGGGDGDEPGSSAETNNNGRDEADCRPCQPVIDTTYPFTSQGVGEAFAKLKSRRAVGKLVIDMEPAA